MTSSILENPSLTEKHLEYVRKFYEQTPLRPTAAGFEYRELLANYYRNLIPANGKVLEVGCGAGNLLELLPNTDVTGIDLLESQIEQARIRVPHGKFHTQSGEYLCLDGTFDYIIVSDTLNFSADVQMMLERLQSVSHPRTRLILNFHSAVWRPILSLATALGQKSKHPSSNWLSASDVKNLLALSGWELIQQRSRILIPFRIFGIETVFNRFLAPLIPWFCLTVFHIARPLPCPSKKIPTVSVIIPARNEAGNIEAAVRRMPDFGAPTEVIFIEGHSSDDTWESIKKVVRENPHMTIQAMRQSGKGKGNAVREAFGAAQGDVLMILDADLTMPPEDLPKFYNVLVSGRAEFANGVRLVYPMEEEAMRFLNLCANKFFSIAFTWVLGQPVKDTLCGTKALFKTDYERLAANRSYFGDFDPFGDFDLIFGADKLQLKMADIPIRYRDRTYGSTNIQRWRHGLLLLHMLFVAARKIKFI